MSSCLQDIHVSNFAVISKDKLIIVVVAVTVAVAVLFPSVVKQVEYLKHAILVSVSIRNSCALPITNDLHVTVISGNETDRDLTILYFIPVVLVTNPVILHVKHAKHADHAIQVW